MSSITVALVALGSYRNTTVRILHPLLEGVDGVKVHTIFFKDFRTRFFSRPTEKEKKLFQAIIDGLKPDLVGFSVLYPFFPMSKTLIKIVRANSPSSLIIMGGIDPTVDPDRCIAESDMICVGEGEGAIVELVEALRDKRPYHNIRNLWIKHESGICKNPMRPLLTDLDSLPSPSYCNPSYYFINKDKLARKDPLLSSNELYLFNSRGCPFACSYCINGLLRHMFKGLGPYTRRRSVDSVIKEIKENLKLPGNRTNYIYFFDEVFNEDRKWLDEFCLKYKQEIGLPFQVSYNSKTIGDATVEKLVSAGLDAINFGIQSGSDYIRNYIFHRAGTNREIINFTKKISRHKIIIRLDIILDNPYDTEETLQEAINLIMQLPKEIVFHIYSLQLFPNYVLTRKAISDKHISPLDNINDDEIEKTAKQFGFIPALLPCDRKQILQNIIWLVAGTHINHHLVKHGVFGSSWGSGLCLIYMNFKAVVYGKIFSQRGIVARNEFLAFLMKTTKYCIKGDFKGFWVRAKRRLRR